ncbi:MAG: aminoacyl-tRNA hydrolase [Ignavibacteria bacterium]|nr:aminoacyl-tRNA hydrolase [Ignavibacteria bacterium]
MKLIVGLGNPGSKYELTRHNIGFIVIDFFAEYLNLRLKEGKGDWIETKGSIEDEEIFLLKPMTYMNNSGIAVKEFMDRNEIENKDVLIIVDDFQIPLGTIRVRKEGSDGGHNGLSSIIYNLISDEFPRMRIGIGKNEPLKKDDFIDFVLGIFDKEEIEKIKKLMPVYIDCINSFVTDGVTKTMNTYNKGHL